MQTFIYSQLNEAKSVLENFLGNTKNIEAIEEAAKLMVGAIQNGNKIISCGNGGSMSDAMHFAEELTGRYRDNRRSLPAIAISDPGFLTCAGNDYGYQFVFSRFIEGMGQPHDVLLAISTSGNSANVIEAAKAAREKGIKVVGLTGKNGGNLAAFCDVEIRVEHQGYADRVQEIHIKIIHTLIGLIETEII
jgi:D-sedoheptulose 7-phosphate isomerase